MGFFRRWLSTFRREAKLVPTTCSSASTSTVYSRETNDCEIFCHRCGDAVEAGKSVLALGRVYHSTHLTCSICDYSLIQGYLPHPSDPDEPVCSDCHSKISNPTCTGCGRPLPETACRLHDKFWHRDCLRCSKCHTVIDKTFCDLNGHVFHSKCMHARVYGLETI